MGCMEPLDELFKTLGMLALGLSRDGELDYPFETLADSDTNTKTRVGNWFGVKLFGLIGWTENSFCPNSILEPFTKVLNWRCRVSVLRRLKKRGYQNTLRYRNKEELGRDSYFTIIPLLQLELGVGMAENRDVAYNTLFSDCLPRLGFI